VKITARHSSRARIRLRGDCGNSGSHRAPRTGSTRPKHHALRLDGVRECSASSGPLAVLIGHHQRQTAAYLSSAFPLTALERGCVPGGPSWSSRLSRRSLPVSCR
jgi:hypothetical protein